MSRATSQCIEILAEESARINISRHADTSSSHHRQVSCCHRSCLRVGAVPASLFGNHKRIGAECVDNDICDYISKQYCLARLLRTSWPAISRHSIYTEHTP